MPRSIGGHHPTPARTKDGRAAGRRQRGGHPPLVLGLQQIRWPPSNIADTPEEALSRMVSFGPAAHFSDPELAWKFEVGPGGIGFMEGRGLGPQYAGDLFMGGSRDFLEGGHIFRIQLTGNRRKVAVDDPRLEDGWPTTSRSGRGRRARA
jgi:hypothetical protein